jgi:internalin A
VTDRGLAQLAPIATLRQLDLEECRIDGSGLDALRSLPALDDLNLQGTDLTDDGLAVVSKLPHLRFLRAGETRATGAGLKWLVGMRSLEALDIVGLSLERADLEKLHGLSKLRDLSLSPPHGEESAAEIARLRAALPKCEVRVVPAR